CRQLGQDSRWPWTSAGTVSPLEISSSRSSPRQAASVIAQLPLVKSAALADLLVDARGVGVNGADVQAQLDRDLGAGAALGDVLLVAGPGRRLGRRPDVAQGGFQDTLAVGDGELGLEDLVGGGHQDVEPVEVLALGPALAQAAAGPVHDGVARHLPQP